MYNKINILFVQRKEWNISWVITISPFWDDYQKNILWDASNKAGLINKNLINSLSLLIEPEAVLFYSYKNNINKGVYLICNIDNKEGYVVLHEFGRNEKIKESNSSISNIFSSGCALKLFLDEVIYKLFGFNNFNSFYNQYKIINGGEEEGGFLFNEWKEFEKQIKYAYMSLDFAKIKNKEFYPIIFV
jgi:uncharacterized protein (DUF1015 family)